MNSAAALRSWVSRFANSIILVVIFSSQARCDTAPLKAEAGAATALARQDQLDRVLQEYDRRGTLSGTIYARFRDGTVYEKGIKFANDRERRVNAPDTLALISSVSKGYTTAAILKLDDLDRLSVEDPLEKFFPEYPARHLMGQNGSQATIHHLLNHTSGIPDAYDDPSIDRKLFEQKISIDEIINAIKAKSLKGNPGARFTYSNTGYILLGEIVRRVSGESFAAFSQNHLFDPLGLTQTFVGVPASGRHLFARSYEKTNRGRVDYVATYDIRELHVTDVFTDGNIIATAMDVGKWAYGLAQNAILSSEALDKIFHDYGAGYGYGWDVQVDSNGHKTVSHAGAWVGYASYVVHALETGETMSYLLNQEMSEQEESQFRRRLKEIVFTSAVKDVAQLPQRSLRR